MRPTRAIAAVPERSAAVIAGLEQLAPEFVLILPSSALAAIVDHFAAAPGVTTFPVAREEEGVGILSGLALAGRRAVLLIQDNGVGNLLTALTTFPLAYHIPLLVVVARRGGLGEQNAAIHAISERVEAVLAAAGVRYFTLDGRTPLADWPTVIVRAEEHARVTHRPVFLLVDLLGG